MNPESTPKIPFWTFVLSFFGTLAEAVLNGGVQDDDLVFSFFTALALGMLVSILKELLLDQPPDWQYKTYIKSAIFLFSTFMSVYTATYGLDYAASCIPYSAMIAVSTGAAVRLLFLVFEEYGHIIFAWLRQEPAQQPAARRARVEVDGWREHQPIMWEAEYIDDSAETDAPAFGVDATEIEADSAETEPETAETVEPTVSMGAAEIEADGAILTVGEGEKRQTRLRLGNRLIPVTPDLYKWLNIVIDARAEGKLPSDATLSERALHNLGISRFQTIEDENGQTTPAKLVLGELNRHKLLKKQDDGSYKWTTDGKRLMPSSAEIDEHRPPDFEQPSQIFGDPAFTS